MKLREWLETKIEKNYSISEYPQEILDEISNYTVSQKIIEDGVGDRDLFDTLVMEIDTFP